jgi:hypothetical protein
LITQLFRLLSPISKVVFALFSSAASDQKLRIRLKPAETNKNKWKINNVVMRAIFGLFQCTKVKDPLSLQKVNTQQNTVIKRQRCTSNQTELTIEEFYGQFADLQPLFQ